jgi:hypothetical protein
MSAVCAVRPDHEWFVREVLPLAERRARRAFWRLRCPHRRADAVQDVVIDAWAAYRRLCEQGRGEGVTPGALVRFSILRVRCGRRLHGSYPRGGYAPDRDALSWKAQLRLGRRTSEYEGRDDWQKVLTDGRRTPVAEQAAFRLDFNTWLRGRTEQERQVMATLATGERAMHAARRHGVTPSWVTKARTRWAQSWERFIGR